MTGMKRSDWRKATKVGAGYSLKDVYNPERVYSKELYRHLERKLEAERAQGFRRVIEPIDMVGAIRQIIDIEHRILTSYPAELPQTLMAVNYLKLARLLLTDAEDDSMVVELKPPKYAEDEAEPDDNDDLLL